MHQKFIEDDEMKAAVETGIRTKKTTVPQNTKLRRGSKNSLHSPQRRQQLSSSQRRQSEEDSFIAWSMYRLKSKEANTSGRGKTIFAVKKKIRQSLQTGPACMAKKLGHQHSRLSHERCSKKSTYKEPVSGYHLA